MIKTPRGMTNEELIEAWHSATDQAVEQSDGEADWSTIPEIVAIEEELVKREIEPHKEHRMNYLLINRTGVFTRRVTLEQAAQEMGLEADHILWAIENYGRCDVGSPTGAELVVITDEFEDGVR